MTDFLQEIKSEYDPKFDELNSKAQEIGEKLGDDKLGDEERKALTTQVSQLDEQVKELTHERDKKIASEEQKSLHNRIESLEGFLNESREPHSDFVIAGGQAHQKAAHPYEDRSFFADAKAVLGHNDSEARERWEEAMGEGKALTASSGSTGGFLVPDQIASELLEFREAQSVLRGLFSSVQVSSDTLRIAKLTSGLLAGWVAELAEKPVSDLTFAELSVNVFQKAGMAVASNQLLKDANRSVDRLIYRDLAKRLIALEEAAFINGSGTNQPQGILNTTDVEFDTVVDNEQLAILDQLLVTIGDIYANYYGPPEAIVMHPRTWAWLVSERNADGEYLIGNPGQDPKRTASDPITGATSSPYYRGTLFGVPVYTSPHVPTDRGVGTDESAIIVGAFSEGLILDREGVTLDSSEHVYFTQNATIFRAEDRVGFTAARYPSAFRVIEGAGLAGV